MARANTKIDLIKSAGEQFDKMQKLVDSMTDDAQNKPFDFGGNPGKSEAHWTRDENLRDVFIHLYEWHNLLLNWVNSNQSGDSKPFLPAPYNWKTYGEMNVEFWEKHQATSYADSRKMLCDSHKKVMKLIENFTDEELFTKKYFSWVGTTSLGSYCVSATASHYDWAIKKIKLHIKSGGV